MKIQLVFLAVFFLALAKDPVSVSVIASAEADD